MKYTYIIHIQFLFTFILLNFLEISSVWTKFDYNTEVGYKVINSTSGNGPILPLKAEFGHSLANIGDLNDDGVEDLAVGAIGETCIGNLFQVATRCGAIYILLMKSDATVLTSIRITNRVNGGPEFLQDNDNFGSSIAPAGDVDGDGILDILVGSTETIQGGTIYVLFMKLDGTVRDYSLIRGVNGNGPPVSQFTRMGYTLANLGDLDNDNRPEFAVSSYDSSNNGQVFLFTLSSNGSMVYWEELILRNSTGQTYIPPLASGFGWSISPIGDVNNDGMKDIAIGAPLYSDPSGVREGGGVFIILMNKTTIIDYHLANDSPNLKKPIELGSYDRCGASLTTIGDINNDQLRGRNPNQPREKGDRNYGARSINDLVVGCTQSTIQSATGKYLFLFLSGDGSFADSSFPPFKYPENGPSPPLQSLFGASMTYLITSTIEQENLTPLPLVVGAPDGNGISPGTGSLYILYLRRRKYHPPAFNIIKYYLSIVLPLFFVCIGLIVGITLFCLYFRRKPDEIEIAVKKAGVEIGLQRKRMKNITKKDATVYADEYN